MKKKDLAAGLGLIGACALCCAIPLLGGAVALGISSFFFNPGSYCGVDSYFCYCRIHCL